MPFQFKTDSTPALQTTPALVQFQDEFLQAKEAEDQWKDRKDYFRKAIMEGLEAMGLDQQLPDSGKVHLEKVDITSAQKTILDQAAVQALFQKFPAEAMMFFKPEFKLSVKKEQLLQAANIDTEFGQCLNQCFALGKAERRFSKRK